MPRAAAPSGEKVISDTASRPSWTEFAAEIFNPFVAAVHARDSEAARRALLDARRALSVCDYSADEVRAMEINLAFFELQLVQFFGGFDEGRSAFDRMNAYLRSVPDTPLARQQHSLRQLAVLVIGETKGWADVPEQRIQTILERLDEDARTPEMWHYVSAWAFAHQHHRLMEQAFAALTVQPGNFMASAGWKRVNLMYLLLERRAGERDVLEYLSEAATLNMLREFRRAILPVLEQQGLATPTVLNLLSDRLDAFEASPPVPPAAERATAGLLNRH